MTYGQLKFRLTKAFPGVDADLIEGWITDCYGEILGAIPWTRLDVEAILQTTAPYSTGTVSATQGSTALVLTGGAWTSSMSGIAFRLGTDQEEYQFTFTDLTHGSVDRNYIGATNALATYSIYQAIYPLPADCRFLDEDAFDSFELGPLKRLRFEQGQRNLSNGNWLGRPESWWPYMDDGSTPPQMQVKLWPVPDQAYGIPFTYASEAATPSGTSFTLLPWTSPTCLIEGSTARIKRHLKDYTGSELAKAAYTVALENMKSDEAYRRGPTTMIMASHYTAHRRGRCR